MLLIFPHQNFKNYKHFNTGYFELFLSKEVYVQFCK
jgi:hypothetical protein